MERVEVAGDRAKIPTRFERKIWKLPEVDGGTVAGSVCMDFREPQHSLKPKYAESPDAFTIYLPEK